MQTDGLIPATIPLSAAARPLLIGRLGRNRLIVAAALGVIAAAAAWQWNWLVAIGAAPLLLSVAPCAAMCGLGLCMHRMGGRACATPPQDGNPVHEAPQSPSTAQET